MAQHAIFVLIPAAAILAGGNAARAQCQEPLRTLVGSDEYALDIAIDGDVMAAGRHEQFVSASLFIYERDGAQWREAAEFHLGGPFSVTPSPSVAVSGDRVAAGMHRIDAVSVFRRDGGAWAIEQIIAPDLGGWPATFGYEIAMDGDTLFAARSDEGDSVQVYQVSGGEWVLQQSLRSPDPDDRFFGRSISLDGDAAAILAARGIEHVVLIFRKRSQEWRLDAEIPIELSSRGSLAGELIDLDGDALIVAARDEDEVAHIYRFDGVEWTLTARLPGPWRYGAQPPSYTTRGTASVTIENDRALAVGKVYDGDLGRSGVAYVFRHEGGQWLKARRLLEGAHPASDYGHGLAVEGSQVAISSPRSYFGGAIHLYDLDETPVDCPVPAPSLDDGLRLHVEGMLTPQSPEASVTMEAFFVPTHTSTAFGGVRTSVVATEAGWQTAEVLLTGIGGGGAPGEIAGGRVDEIRVGQIGMFASTANPLALWRATFVPDDFAPRVIDLRTDTRLFEILPLSGGHDHDLESRIAGMPEAEARIRVWASSCLADCDGSGRLDFADFLCFQDLVAAGNLAADLDDDGELTFFDFLAFQDAFTTGCP